MFHITSVDFSVEGKGVVNTGIDADETLLDSDIVIVDPGGIAEIIGSRFGPHPSTKLDLHTYRQYSQRMAALPSELSTLLSQGKIIIVFLSPVRNFWSVTSHGRKVILSNYAFLPAGVSGVTKHIQSGKAVTEGTLSLGKRKTAFDDIFHGLKKDFKYEAYIDRAFETEKNSEEDFIFNRSKKPVGVILRKEEGVTVFLPRLKGKKDSQVISLICQSAKKFFRNDSSTPAPDWTEIFSLPGEEELRSDLSVVQKEMKDLLDQKQNIQKKIEEISSLKGLLFETGTRLEDLVREGFSLLGFEVTKRDTGTEEHDILFYSAEGKGIAEVEGKDNSWINVAKMDQLSRAVDEDFDITEEYAKGILVGNHFRLKRPEDREEAFTEKAKRLANMKRFALLNTVQLFSAVKYVLENPEDQKFKDAARQAIFNTEGEEVNFEKLIEASVGSGAD